MTTEELQLGSVIHYPFRWRHQLGGIPHPKDRPACIVLKLEVGEGQFLYAIAAISEKEPSEIHAAVEIPSPEKRLGGLDPDRRAFVQLAEINTDNAYNSYTIRRRMPVKGRFSAGFVKRISAALADNLRMKRIFLIDRTHE